MLIKSELFFLVSRFPPGLSRAGTRRPSLVELELRQGSAAHLKTPHKASPWRPPAFFLSIMKAQWEENRLNVRRLRRVTLIRFYLYGRNTGNWKPQFAAGAGPTSGLSCRAASFSGRVESKDGRRAAMVGWWGCGSASIRRGDRARRVGRGLGGGTLPAGAMGQGQAAPRTG